MKYQNIKVLVARSVEAVDGNECDDERSCDTIKEARAFAKYALTSDYQKSAELSQPMNYARIEADEVGGSVAVVVAEFYRRGYSLALTVAVRLSQENPALSCTEIEDSVQRVLDENPKLAF